MIMMDILDGVVCNTIIGYLVVSILDWTLLLTLILLAPTLARLDIWRLDIWWIVGHLDIPFLWCLLGYFCSLSRCFSLASYSLPSLCVAA